MSGKTFSILFKEYCRPGVTTFVWAATRRVHLRELLVAEITAKYFIVRSLTVGDVSALRNTLAVCLTPERPLQGCMFEELLASKDGIVKLVIENVDVADHLLMANLRVEETTHEHSASLTHEETLGWVAAEESDWR